MNSLLGRWVWVLEWSRGRDEVLKHHGNRMH